MDRKTAQRLDHWLTRGPPETPEPLWECHECTWEGPEDELSERTEYEPSEAWGEKATTEFTYKVCPGCGSDWVAEVEPDDFEEGPEDEDE